MENKHKNKSNNITMPFCRACLHPDAKVELNYKLFEDITSIKVSSKKSTNWICYKCEMIIKNFNKFRLLCLQVDNIIKKIVGKKKKKSRLETLDAEKSKLPQFKNLTVTNIIYIDTNKPEQTVDNTAEVLSHSQLLYNNSKVMDDSSNDIKSNTNDYDDVLEYSSNEDYCATIESHQDMADHEPNVRNNLKTKSVKSRKIKSITSYSMTDSESDIIEKSNNPKTEIEKKKYLIHKKSSNEIKLTEEEQLFEHQQRLTDEKYIIAQFKCEMCVIPFRHEFTLKNHMEKHSEARGSHICPLCKQRFESVRQLRAHSSLHAVRLICTTCGERLRDRARLADHLAWHEGHTYVCNLCNAVFVRRTTLKNHIRLKHSDDQYKCEFCNKTFSGKERLKEHELRHSSPAHSCNICGKQFYTVANLSNHMISHSNSRRHYCVECDIYFKSASILRNHLYNTAKHIDPTLLQFSCDQCAKRFRSKILLTRHIDATHLRRKQFSCEICAASYASRQGLNFHRRLAHQGFRLPRSHQCNVCNKSFSAKGLLVNHMRVHTGEKPFECSQCHHKFSQKSSLRTHIKLVHLKIKRIIKKKARTDQPDQLSSENINLTITNKTSDDKPWENKMIINERIDDTGNLQSGYFNSQIHESNQYL